MSSSNLISLERARRNLPSATPADERTIDVLIGACSDAVRKYCRRHFALARWDEVLDGDPGAERLLLREYPIQSVESVRHGPRVVLEVTNAATATNQQARVTVTRDGLELVRVASGARAVDTSVTWAACPTLGAVAAAVVALGGGWSARAVSDFGLWPSQDLFTAPGLGEVGQSQGALDCRGRWAGLVLHADELGDYAWDARGWLVARGLASWDGGPGHWRVQYTAGYPEVPEAVQEATAEWVSALFGLTGRDPGAVMVSQVGIQSQTYPREGIPTRVRWLLAPYRRHTL